jgi:hypothetical protein
MVEMAIGVTIFLVAAFGAVQLGLSALADEGIQSAALAGGRVASEAPQPGNPLARLSAGQSAAVSALGQVELGLARNRSCSGASICGIGGECVLYQGQRPMSGTELPCDKVGSRGDSSLAYGPLPADLDGQQNPACSRGNCAGIATSMSECGSGVAPGTLSVCLAYTSWPATAVDVWIVGGLRTIVPWVSSAGADVDPVDVRLRLHVEAFAP